MFDEKEIELLQHLSGCAMSSETQQVLEKAVAYLKKPNVEKVLDMLDLKIGEEFEIRKRFGVFSLGEDLHLNLYYSDEKTLVNADTVFIEMLNGKIDSSEIIKLPPKPLLTEDEKKFLSYFPNIEYVKKSTTNILEIKSLNWSTIKIKIGDMSCELPLKFDGLENNKEYTRKELGI